MLPDRCIGANIDAIIAGAQITHADRAVSWLPLYHDMGLIGLLMTPMLHGFELVLGAPQDFLAAPVDLVGVDLGVPRHDHRGSQLLLRPRGACAAARRRARPVELAARAQRRRDRRPGRGGERSAPRRPPSGSTPRAAYPVFGMAEATLGGDVPRGRRGDDRRRGRTPRARARPAWRGPSVRPGARVRRLAFLGRPLARLRAAHRRPREPATSAVSARSASSSSAARR